MKRLLFSPGSDPDTALLINQDEVKPENKIKFGIHYFKSIAETLGAKVSKRTMAIGTYHPSSGKVKKKDIVVMTEEILEYCDTNGITTLLVADSAYFKYLAGVTAVEKHIGEKFECVVPGYGDITILPMVNFASVLMFPEKKELLDKANAVAASVMAGNYEVAQGFEFESYELATELDRAKELLASYMDHPILACDIETTGLAVGPTELLTIAFGKDAYNAFTIPLHPHYELGNDVKMRGIVKRFLIDYPGRLIFHNGLYDAKQLIYTLFMEDFNDVEGMVEGCNALKFDDTFILAYLMKNSTGHPSLGLKDLTYDFLGDYGENVKEAIKLPLDKIGVYNAKDVCGTFHIYNQFKEALDYEVYTTIMEPSFKPLLKMMLNGMPMDIAKVEEVGIMLEKKVAEVNEVLDANEHVKLAVRNLRQLKADQYNEKHVRTTRQPGDFMDLKFNPNSTNQLRILLFDVMGFEPVELTSTGLPSTNRASIEEFAQFADMDKKPALEALVLFSQTAIILSTFIGAFREMRIIQDGEATLHGNLKLGGTQSGRLSSNSPNMQNLPSGSEYGKAIKSCFVPPEGWLFAGADFNALEDRVGAILSKDPNKLKEVLDGFDGHSLRALAFFPDELEDLGLGNIDPDDKDSVNRIKDEADKIRSKAKPVSFLKQYGGGASKIQKVLKCSPARAGEISDAYDDLYKVSLMFNARNNDFARANGYVECAWGLKLRTPRINSRDNKIKSSEERSSNNAVTQSWGMLMNRAFIEFDQRIEDAGYSDSIKLINTIHDAVYMLIKADPKVVMWANKNLVECMEWQDHPRLESEIRMSANLEIGKSWAQQIELENGASLEDITKTMEEL